MRKKLFFENFAGWNLNLKNTFLVICQNFNCSKIAQIRHAFGPENSQTYGEKISSIGSTVKKLQVFLGVFGAIFVKTVKKNIKKNTKPLVRLSSSNHHMS